MRYWRKKVQRITKKHVRYTRRSKIATQRYRFKGRFVTKEEKEQLEREEVQDILECIEPIFKVSKKQDHHCKCQDHDSCRCPDITGASGAASHEFQGKETELLGVNTASHNEN